MSADDYARGFKDHCAHGQQGRCATCVEAFARVRADERAAVLSVTQLDVGRAHARGFAAGIKAAAKVCEVFLHNVPDDGGDELDRIGRYSNDTVRHIIAKVRALANQHHHRRHWYGAVRGAGGRRADADSSGGRRRKGQAMSRPDTMVIKARAEAATPGPWLRFMDRVPGRRSSVDVAILKAGRPGEVCGFDQWKAPSEADAAFMVCARTDVPALCDRVDALEAALRDVLDQACRLVDESGAATSDTGDHLMMTMSLARIRARTSAALKGEP